VRKGLRGVEDRGDTARKGEAENKAIPHLDRKWTSHTEVHWAN